MEEADKLMLRTLRDLDCEIEEETVSLGQLTTDQVRAGRGEKAGRTEGSSLDRPLCCEVSPHH